MSLTRFLINSLRPTRHLKRRLLFLRSFHHSAVMTEFPKLSSPASGLCMMFPPNLQAGLFSTQPIEKGPDRLGLPGYTWFSKLDAEKPAQQMIDTLLVT